MRTGCRCASSPAPARLSLFNVLTPAKLYCLPSSPTLLALPPPPPFRCPHRIIPLHPLCDSSGIGLETSFQFASEGAHVLLADINRPSALKVAEYINSQFPNCGAEAVKCDVSVEGDVKGMVEKAVGKWGRLDVMVSPSLAVSTFGVGRWY